MATARPMPLSPPVMIATLPSSLPLPRWDGSSARGRGVISASIPGWRACFCGGILAGFDFFAAFFAVFLAPFGSFSLAMSPPPSLQKASAPGKGALETWARGSASADQRLLVDMALGELGQPLVGLLLLLERALEESDVVLLVEQLGVGAHGAI